jgi:hypothetical protein
MTALEVLRLDGSHPWRLLAAKKTIRTIRMTATLNIGGCIKRLAGPEVKSIEMNGK